MRNEIQRLQELAGLNEMKINNPNKTFKITDLGIQALEDYHRLLELAKKFDVSEILKDDGPEYDKFRITQLLHIFSDIYGEGIIKTNGLNTLDGYISSYMDIWDGEDESYANKDLKDFIKMGYVTPIKL
jgi:hypothetical protein